MLYKTKDRGRINANC